MNDNDKRGCPCLYLIVPCYNDEEIIRSSAAITIDADLQQDVEAMDNCLRCYKNGAEIVYGVRRNNIKMLESQNDQPVLTFKQK